MKRRSLHRSPSLACSAVLVLSALSCGCATASVWGLGREAGPSSGSELGSTRLSDSEWINILATPFAVAFDICVQICTNVTL